MSGLQVYRSNRLEALVIVLAEAIRSAPGGPLVRTEVVVGSRGMERHLRHALAEHLGICTAVDFPFPSAALDRMVPDFDGRTDPWSTDALAWSVVTVLAAVAARHPELHRYLGWDGSDAVGSRTWGFARQVASTFDGYTVHRPDVLLDWDAGRGGGGWQADVWRAVRQHLDGHPHRAERLARLTDAQADPRTLHVFGMSGLTGSWLDALARVSAHRPVSVYLLCPSDQYWADLSGRLREQPELASLPPEQLEPITRAVAGVGHPLLTSWGRTGRDLQIALETMDDDFEDMRLDLFLDPIDDHPPTMLQHLAADVLSASHPSATPQFESRRADPQDRSVAVHACHGPTRQIEVLREVLLGMLDDDPSLRPRDIVVMTPDIDAMAPLVGAIFDQGGGRQPGRRTLPRIPWELADLAVRRLNPVADALVRVMDLVDDRASASTVLDLLALEPVATRFGLDADDLQTLRGWVVESGIRWGADAAARVRYDQPADVQNTWRFGLQRLLMGIAVPDDGRLPYGVRPMDAVEGADADRLGRFAGFCAVLFDLTRQLARPRPLDQWADALDDVVSQLTRTDGMSAWLTRRVREVIEDLRVEARNARCALPIAVDAVRQSVTQRFDVASAAHQGAGGAVTFCGMVPERAVPYRVVVLLGMDDGAFPRHGDRVAFDLLQQAGRVGDRSDRDEDRYLLLEAVLSARSHLVILYTGRDPQTGEPLPPAAPVGELLAALDATYPDDGGPRPSARVLQDHPLSAYDPGPFLVSGPPTGFDPMACAAAQVAQGTRTPAVPFLVTARSEVPDSVESIDLDDLIRFWRQPAAHQLRTVLGMHLDRDEDALVPDREPIELGGLDRFQIVEELVRDRLAGTDDEQIRRRAIASGVLPLGASGRAAFADHQRVATAMVAEGQRLLQDDPTPTVGMDVDVVVDGVRLVGHLPELSSLGIVRYRHGREHSASLLRLWIEILVRKAVVPTTPARGAWVFGRMSGGTPRIEIIGLSAPEEDHPLERLIEGYRVGVSGGVPFACNSSREAANRLSRTAADPDLPLLGLDPSVVAAGGILHNQLDTQWSGRGGDGQDRHLQHGYEQQPPYNRPDGGLDLEFLRWALWVWGPILQQRLTTSKFKAGWP